MELLLCLFLDILKSFYPRWLPRRSFLESLRGIAWYVCRALNGLSRVAEPRESTLLKLVLLPGLGSFCYYWNFCAELLFIFDLLW